MTPEQKEEVLALVQYIDTTASNKGFYTNTKFVDSRIKENKNAWRKLKAYLESITEPDDGLLEGESIRCNPDPDDSRMLNDQTKDQITSVMLQHGTPEQQEAALAYIQNDPIPPKNNFKGFGP